MRINSINQTYDTKSQSFGNLKPMKPDFVKYLRQDVFVNDQPAYARFIKELSLLAKRQLGNPICDVELYKGVDVFTGEVHPVAQVTDKEGCMIKQFHSNLYKVKYPETQDKYAITLAIQAADKEASSYGCSTMDRMMTESFKKEQRELGKKLFEAILSGAREVEG